MSLYKSRPEKEEHQQPTAICKSQGLFVVPRGESSEVSITPQSHTLSVTLFCTTTGAKNFRIPQSCFDDLMPNQIIFWGRWPGLSIAR